MLLIDREYGLLCRSHFLDRLQFNLGVQIGKNFLTSLTMRRRSAAARPPTAPRKLIDGPESPTEIPARRSRWISLWTLSVGTEFKKVAPRYILQSGEPVLK